MRASAQKSKAIRQPHSANSGRTFSGQNCDANTRFQRAVGNQTAQLMQQNNASGQFQDSETKSHNGLPPGLRTGLEALSGMDLSRIRVHRNSSEPARLNALAYTRGQNIHLGPGQEKYLPHEGWHAVQQMQGRVNPIFRVGNVDINDDRNLESEADRMTTGVSTPPPAGINAASGAETGNNFASSPNGSPGGTSQTVVQRQVRINGGSTRVNEAEYLPGGAKSSIGSRLPVASLIGDSVRRVFDSVAELEGYANGQTDYIGDVATSSAGTFWYRLPENQLTVLGESHHNPNGNVEDVVLGLQTSRFMYEPFNELAGVSALNIPFAGTQSRLTQINSGLGIAGLVDRTHFNPDLENIVIKALTGASITRNQFIAGDPPTMSRARQQYWGSRPSTNDYSFGERTALYLSMAIHIASDIARHDFGPDNFVESLFISSGRSLKNYYAQNQTVLDQFMHAKDGDDLTGIYDLTASTGFSNLTVINDFTLAFHEYASRYLEQLGSESGNTALEAEGQALAGNLGATLTTLSPAREEIMWEKIQHANANAYLIVGMGDAHRRNLQTRLNRAGIPHQEVEQSLDAQRRAVNTGWTP